VGHKIVSPNISICAFEEHADHRDKNRLEAHELFSMFTANIIKKQTKFER
jgi:hypothetical protein